MSAVDTTESPGNSPQSSIDVVELRPGQYQDSVRLMQVSREAEAVPGIERALVAMATELNLTLVRELGFSADDLAGAGPNDLFIAVRAHDDKAVSAVRAVIERALSARVSGSGGPFAAPPLHLVESAGRAAAASVAVISVPGPHAFVEAMAALLAGMHVMVFSDNVPIAQEVALKREAARRDRLVMGPDCGTTILGGVGLGFANVVRPGPASLVGASGTGIQEISCLLDAAGIGIRHAIGTGSRDLSEEVGGIATLQALHALDRDPGTHVIVVVSKPPAQSVADRIRTVAAELSTPTVMAFLGERGTTLEAAATQAIALLGYPEPEFTSWAASEPPRRPRFGFLRGLFCGGSLRDDARMIASQKLGPIAIDESASSHALVDYGDDIYTRGRAHPMIDQSLRRSRLAAMASDSRVGVVLLDLILGHGAHPDPAAELAPAISLVASAGAAVVVSLCGTAGDPQGLSRQAEKLCHAGASVWLSNAGAAEYAARLATTLDEESIP